MNYKKLFFPIGGGEELEERLHGALLIAKTLNVKLDILKSDLTEKDKLHNIPQHIIDEISSIVDARSKSENEEFTKLIQNTAKDLDVTLSLDKERKNALVSLNVLEGLRSDLVEQESKYCDLVIAAAPPSGLTTATFETATLKSGKPVLMFPRVMKNFSFETIIIGWNNSPEASRAVTSSIEFLKQAKKVHIVTSKEYVQDLVIMKNLLRYLKEHDINATYEVIKTTRIPGQALLNTAIKGNFDMIIAGAYGHRGLKELMFGGATRHLLENSTIPVFMSH